MVDRPIAKEILDKIKRGKVEGYLSAHQALMAWGAEKFITHDDADGFGLCWIRFRVHGTKFQGWVKAGLKANNNYDLAFESYNNKTGELSTVRLKQDVPADVLAQEIDSVVEGEIEG